MKEAIYAFLVWLFGNILWDLVLIGILGSGIAYLEKKKSEWAKPALYFVLTGCAILVIAYTLVGHALLSQEQPQTTAENIESNIKTWADKFSLGIQKQTDDKYSFVYAISLPSGRGALVGRPKNREGYLQFQGDMGLGPERIEFLKKISPAQLEQISDEINIEMARGKIGFVIVGIPFKGIVVTKAVPITSSLNEDSFVASLDEIDSSMLLAREAIRLAFIRSGMTTPNAMPRPQSSQ
jgi:hypothetical protein